MPALLAASLPLTAPTVAQGRAPDRRPQDDSIEWQADFASALRMAKEREQLLLVCFNRDGEAANDRAMAEVYQHRSFRQATERTVLVIGSVHDHGGEHSCPRFGSVACAAHREVELAARTYLFGSARTMVAPQHVLLYPDGSVAWQLQYECSAPTIAREIERAQRRWRRGERARLAQAAKDLEAFAGRSPHDEQAFLQTMAVLRRCPVAQFARLFGVIDDDATAERVVAAIAADLRASEAEPRLRAIAAHRNRHLNELVAEHLQAVRERLREAANVVPVAPDKAP